MTPTSAAARSRTSQATPGRSVRSYADDATFSIMSGISRQLRGRASAAFPKNHRRTMTSCAAQGNVAGHRNKPSARGVNHCLTFFDAHLRKAVILSAIRRRSSNKRLEFHATKHHAIAAAPLSVRNRRLSGRRGADPLHLPTGVRTTHPDQRTAQPPAPPGCRRRIRTRPGAPTRYRPARQHRTSAAHRRAERPACRKRDQPRRGVHRPSGDARNAA